MTASFAMLGDVNIAEPKALIGFAGPRVIEQTIRQKLPEGFQRSEFLLEHGMLDLVVDRRELKAAIARVAALRRCRPTARRARSPRRRRPSRPARRARRSLPLGHARPAVEFLFSLERFGMKFGLANIARLCAALGHPAGRVPLDHRRRHQRQGIGDGDGRHGAARRRTS